MGFHSKLTQTDIHTPYRWVWQNETERLSETPSQDDIGKVGIQTDNYKEFYLSAISPSPTWVQVGGNNQHEIKDDATNTTTDVVTISHDSNQTVAEGFGTGFVVKAKDETGSLSEIGKLNWTWQNLNPYQKNSVLEIKLNGNDGVSQRGIISATEDILPDSRPYIGFGSLDFQSNKVSANNTAEGTSCSILSGQSNRIGNTAKLCSIVSGYNSYIKGGYYNFLGSPYNSTIETGSYNVVLSGGGSFINGSSNFLGTGDGSLEGSSNVSGATSGVDINGSWNFALTGRNTAVVGISSGVLTGNLNQITTFGYYNMILNGIQNTVSNGNYHATIINGANNQITAGKYSTIINGRDAVVNNGYETVFISGQRKRVGVIALGCLLQHVSNSWLSVRVDANANENIKVNTDGKRRVTFFKFKIIGAGTTSTTLFEGDLIIENTGTTITTLSETITNTYTNNANLELQIVKDSVAGEISFQVRDVAGGGETIIWTGEVYYVRGRAS